MTLLYRTPNLQIDKAEWHCTVEKRYTRARRYFRFRFPGQMWRPITEWQGRKPKGLGERFAPFKRHMQWAETGVPSNAAGASAS